MGRYHGFHSCVVSSLSCCYRCEETLAPGLQSPPTSLPGRICSRRVSGGAGDAIVVLLAPGIACQVKRGMGPSKQGTKTPRSGATATAPPKLRRKLNGEPCGQVLH